ncbi:MAG: GNAT family N-acetyltransferase [Myxococcales bacterium]|nr:GNAT family N-acetyltransferase [Myxococcales bacterium]
MNGPRATTSAPSHETGGEGWEAVVRLDDGTRLTFRPIEPSDKARLADLMERLSEDSRLRRFLTMKRSLSREELAYLTEVDGIHHLALLALDEADAVAGVGRLVRDPNRLDAAEAAIVVADALQGRGLGTRLLRLLLTAARERTVRWVHLEMHVDNVAMRRLAERYDATVVQASQGVAHFTIDLAPEA